MFPQLINARSYEITGVEELGSDRTMVEVTVQPRSGDPGMAVTFALRRKSLGANKGSWITRMLLSGTVQDALNHVETLQQRGG